MDTFTPSETVPLLTRDDEVALLRRMDAGTIADAVLAGRHRSSCAATHGELLRLVEDGEAARRRFVAANIGLVRYVVRAVAERTGQPRRELFQEGMVGLLEALPRFDPRRGKFATCALPQIRMRVGDAAVTNQGALGLPARRARQWRRARAAVGELTSALAREPQLDEIAVATGETCSVVRTLLAFTPVVPLDRDDPRWLDLCAAPEADDEHEPALVHGLLRRLDDFDLNVVAQLYGLDGPARTHAEVAGLTGRSESTVRRAERRALALMRAGEAMRAAA